MTKRLIPCLNILLVEKIVPPSKTTADILLPEKSSKMFVWTVQGLSTNGAIPTRLRIGNALLTAPRGLATGKHLADSFSNHYGSSSPTRLENHHTNTWVASAILHPSCRVFQHLFFFHDTHLSMHNCT
ncbi:hypothetical protein L1887_39533 [Cichorium endivia]|nr:hypothetical protein L1887_39533 [Cichorium endivia]